MKIELHNHSEMLHNQIKKIELKPEKTALIT